MEYDERLYYAEDIGGFHVSAMDKRFKYSGLESLEEYDRVCRLYNIPYFAMYGTLLGTIRHKGFIPWDDDIDVAMLRSDYNKFIRIAKTELRQPFILNNVENSCFHPLRVQNGSAIRFNREFLERFHLCPYPTGIDIYVFDTLPETEDEQNLLKTVFYLVKLASQYYDKLYEKYGGVKWDELDEEVKEIVCTLENLLNVKIERDGTEDKQLARLAYRLAAMFSDSNSDYVARIETWYADGIRGKFHKDLFKETILMPFEHMMLPVPVGYDEILTHLYGDYMVPVKGGGAHQYRAYSEHEEILFARFKELGEEIPQFLKE